MKEFLLNENIGINFKIFNGTHFITLAITYILMVLIILNKNKLSSVSLKNKKIIQFGFGLFLVSIFLIRRISYVYYGVYDFKYHLDLGFCNITVILFIIYCLSGNIKLYKLCYYAVFGGPLLSILLPSVDLYINNFSFIVFILFHNILFLANLVFFEFNKVQFDKKDSIRITICCIIYIFFTNIIDIIFNFNYNQLSEFISDDYLKNIFIFYLANNFFTSMLIYIFLAIICLKIANYFIKILGGKNEKKKTI